MTRAIILAAGEGSRLRPYTQNIPKCMVQFGGKPLLHWQLGVLENNNINDICVVGGYKSEKLDSKNLKLLLNPLYAKTNMVSTLFCAREFMRPGEDLLICYGDIVYEKRVLSTILAGNAEVTIAADRQWKKLWEIRMDEPLDDAETFKLTKAGKIYELGKKPSSYDDIDAQYIGLIKVRHDKVDQFIAFFDNLDRNKLYDGKDFPNMYMTSFIQLLIDNNWDVEPALIDNGWLEIDTASELETYQDMLRDGSLDDLYRLPKV